MGEVELKLIASQLEQLQPGSALSEQDFERLGSLGKTHSSATHLVQR